MGNPFDDIFSAFTQQRTDLFNDALGKLRVKAAQEKATEERVQTLIRKAQNNIDRAHNRAIRAAAEVEDLDFFAKKKILRLVKPVRHAEEFGES